MILPSIIIVLCYGVLIITLGIGFNKVKEFTPSVEIPKTKFSIIIPFRNEENNLTELLNSLSLLNYPKELFEILMIDDDSDDDSIKIIELSKTRYPNLPILILENLRESTSPKKDAIETAINKAQFDWIITTDADCIVPKNWLQTFDAFIQTHQPKLVATPVTYIVGNSFLEQFQLFDFLSLQAATIGGFGLNKPFLCNGANLCYQKSVYFEVNGFEGNAHIASGDDIFLMEKIKNKFPNGVQFLKSKDALVYTKPQPTLKSLISQRVRWAAKTSSVKTTFTKLVGVIVFIINFLLVLTVFMVLAKLVLWQHLLLLFMVKLVLDLSLLLKVFFLFKQPFNVPLYLLSSLCYPFFSMFVIALSFNKGFRWKGRSFKK
ncbi:glycosyltransferase [Aureibaculum conchae]|uniref:glycosyltransferase n=1 Tax=Aureibaculum sp. 2308TA14-22 TaxID=3108392 RepID=UPI00339363B0